MISKEALPEPMIILARKIVVGIRLEDNFFSTDRRDNRWGERFCSLSIIPLRKMSCLADVFFDQLHKFFRDIDFCFYKVLYKTPHGMDKIVDCVNIGGKSF